MSLSYLPYAKRKVFGLQLMRFNELKASAKTTWNVGLVLVVVLVLVLGLSSNIEGQTFNWTRSLAKPRTRTTTRTSEGSSHSVTTKNRSANLILCKP